MSVRIVSLDDLRLPEEGVRIGAVRRPSRGVRKERYAADDWFDVWYPDLAPSNELMSQGNAASTDGEWAAFVKVRAEMSEPMARRSLDLLSALSHGSRFSIGCYCEDESRCHRSVLRELLSDRRASIG
ncbi:DUF488 domain-containing protein [Phyllobacterium bourgognense]|uniref:Uncharacterized protein YeaO (DUF488 family) n=1 Tax=Phyllobacterium bourgognense TaxID=314236 RepID=A0A368YKM9_9HYPH|nr:DUF488 family protein [Phyllobacterium bourgognense]RCW78704.1 uncharacterized protein YeaO (DUF488 family) [Phyllobacterium bourgognense]